MKVWSALALILLAACQSATPPTAPFDMPLRNPTAPVAAQANLDVAKLAGDWVVRQSFADHGFQPGAMVGLGVTADGGFRLQQTGQHFTPSGTGRWTAEDGTDWWFHWVDVGYRTAVVGTPDGSFGWIMDRAAAGGGDRIAAARDMMDWFGYDTARMNGARMNGARMNGVGG